jgi:Rad3-related DNA helicase
MEQYPTIYQINAIQKIVQGAGRSVRSADDWAITYMLDTAIQRVWQTGLNEWRSEFTTSFSSVLEHDEA